MWLFMLFRSSLILLVTFLGLGTFTAKAITNKNRMNINMPVVDSKIVSVSMQLEAEILCI